MQIKRRLIGAILLLAASFSAYAFNFSFLDHSPVAYFTQQDWQIISATGNKVLDNARDGVKVGWKNAHTGAFGYFIPSKTTRQNGVLCRNLTLFENAHGYTNEATYHFCKINGEWKTA